jgi:predicted amino acid racemase
MHNDVFKLFSEIIEITEKPDTPTGELGESGVGNTYIMDDNADLSVTSLRAILDIGLLDMQPQYITAEDEDITIVDASSDMLVIDISNSKKKYKIGDLVSFKIQYMGALYLLNSDYIEKTIS